MECVAADCSTAAVLGPARQAKKARPSAGILTVAQGIFRLSDRKENCECAWILALALPGSCLRPLRSAGTPPPLPRCRPVFPRVDCGHEFGCALDGRHGGSAACDHPCGVRHPEHPHRQSGIPPGRPPALDRGALAGGSRSRASQRPAPVILPLLIPTLGVQDLVLALVAVLVLFWLVYRALLAVIERPNRR